MPQIAFQLNSAESVNRLIGRLSSSDKVLNSISASVSSALLEIGLSDLGVSILCSINFSPIKLFIKTGHWETKC